MSEPLTETLHVRVSASTDAKLRALAEKEHRKIAALLSILIDEALAAREES